MGHGSLGCLQSSLEFDPSSQPHRQYLGVEPINDVNQKVMKPRAKWKTRGCFYYALFFHIESKMDAKGMRTLTGCMQCFWRIGSHWFLRWYSMMMILIIYIIHVLITCFVDLSITVPPTRLNIFCLTATRNMARHNTHTHTHTRHVYTVYNCMQHISTICNNIYWVSRHRCRGENLEPADGALLFEALSSQAIFNPKSLESQKEATLPAM